MVKPISVSWRLVIVLSAFVLAIAMIIGLSQNINQVKAEELHQVTGEPEVTFVAPTGPAPTPLNNCLSNICTGGLPSNCTAHDATLANVYIADVKDACEYWGDYGIFQFMTNCTANASTRYDPFMWYALDGGDAQTGTCGYGFMGGELISAPVNPPTLQIGPPFYDLECPTPGGCADQCGDIVNGVYTHARSPYYTIYCTPDFMNGKMGAVFAWNNNQDLSICDATHPNCPATSSKCFTGPITFESIAHPVDLAIEVTAGGYQGTGSPNVDPGEVFYYDFKVTNVGAYAASGYNVYADLPSWLKVVAIPSDPPILDWFERTNDGVRDDGIFVTGLYYPDNQAAVVGYVNPKGVTLWDGPWGDRNAEYCSSVGGSNVCNGYSDIVRLNIMTDLAPNESHIYRVYVRMYTKDTTYCQANPGDPRCNQQYDYPSTIELKGCTWPFDHEPTFGGCQDPLMCDPSPVPPTGGSWENNCDIENVPTKVKIAWFEAAPTEKSIMLKWETTQELNNMGFNIYRTTSRFFSTRFGAVKINNELIPSLNPGGNVGASYYFEDTTARPGVQYYYWLEDVGFDNKTAKTGPAIAKLEMKIQPIESVPVFIIPGSKP